MGRTLYGGVDWGHGRSRVVVEDEAGSLVDQTWVDTEPEELRKFARQLAQQADGGDVRIMIEATAGPVVTAMLSEGFEVYAINPKQVDRAREFLSMSKAKDDHRDARVMLWMLRSCPESACLLSRREPQLVALRVATRRYRDISDKSVEGQNQAREIARLAFPNLLKLGDFNTKWMLTLVQMAPSSRRLHALGARRIQKVLSAHRVRKYDARAVLEIVGTDELELSDAEAEACAFDLELLCSQLLLLTDQKARLRRRLDELLKRYSGSLHTEREQPTDVDIVRSLPGVGAIVTGSYFGEGLVLLLKANLAAARAYSGAAPVSTVTGKRQQQQRPAVSMRRACNTFLRNAIHTMAEKSVPNDDAMKARYKALRARGHTHGRACRQLADKQLGCLRAMLRDRTLYNPALLGV